MVRKIKTIKKIYYIDNTIQCLDYVRYGNDLLADKKYDSYLCIDPGWKQLGIAYFRLVKGSVAKNIDDIFTQCIYLVMATVYLSGYNDSEDEMIIKIYDFARSCEAEFESIDAVIIENQTMWAKNKWLQGALSGAFICHDRRVYSVKLSKLRVIGCLNQPDDPFIYNADRKYRKKDCRVRIINKFIEMGKITPSNAIIDVNARRYDCTDAFLLLYMTVNDGKKDK